MCALRGGEFGVESGTDGETLQKGDTLIGNAKIRDRFEKCIGGIQRKRFHKGAQRFFTAVDP